jgi:MFS family permease
MWAGMAVRISWGSVPPMPSTLLVNRMASTNTAISCALQPLGGKLYTHLVLKYTFLTYLAVFELGSALCGAASSSKMLIVGRAVAGMGGSGLVIGTLTILRAVAPKHQQPGKCIPAGPTF